MSFRLLFWRPIPDAAYITQLNLTLFACTGRQTRNSFLNNLTCHFKSFSDSENLLEAFSEQILVSFFLHSFTQIHMHVLCLIIISLRCFIVENLAKVSLRVQKHEPGLLSYFILSLDLVTNMQLSDIFSIRINLW